MINEHFATTTYRHNRCNSLASNYLCRRRLGSSCKTLHLCLNMLKQYFTLKQKLLEILSQDVSEVLVFH